ncbi:MAG: hypothetical protein GXC73_16575 [Chitinophagaceae bacterium]|nr:hypothetical protein [Chitinophagaceae bacterium]
MKHLFICISVFLLYSCNSLFAQTIPYTCKNYLSDTSNIVILPFSVKGYHFNKDYIAPILPKIDLCLIEELLIRAINSAYFEIHLNERENWVKEIMTTYKKQLIFATDKKGHQFVWINCMCKTDGGYWRKNIPMFFDGGACYFSLKLNLTTKEYFDIYISSYG